MSGTEVKVGKCKIEFYLRQRFQQAKIKKIDRGGMAFHYFPFSSAEGHPKRFSLTKLELETSRRLPYMVVGDPIISLGKLIQPELMPSLRKFSFEKEKVRSCGRSDMRDGRGSSGSGSGAAAATTAAFEKNTT
ncbi:hypothetical protein RUM43_002513 [Polyplax serrata]|uniref:Uncharacterized protein n=1 Tax=Polyplax serrata TaxID=468196 RepID=A0AAN8PZL7_POLSC